MKKVRLGCGMAFWGDSVNPAVEMVKKGDIQYLCCDHLAELTMSILNKQKARNPEYGYTRDILTLLKKALPTIREKGIKVITNAGGANPEAAAKKIAELCESMGYTGMKIGLVTGDDISGHIDDLMAQGVTFNNMDTGEPLSTVREKLTHASVYIGSEKIVEALAEGADIVVCGRVTDVALYLGPMMYEFGWKADDWDRLAAGTIISHCLECGGQGTGGLFSGGWQDMPDLENLGYPIADVFENGEAILTKTPGTGGRVNVATVSEQLVYEILDPANYYTADVVADLTDVRLEEVGEDQVRLSGVKGKPRPENLKVNMGYRAGYVGEAQFTYTWPEAYAKAQRGIEFLKNRLSRADFKFLKERIEYVGYNAVVEHLLPPPNDPDLMEITVRYAAQAETEAEAQKIFTESVPLYNNGPAGVCGIGTRPPIKELYALWSALVPREMVPTKLTMLEV